MTVNIEAASTGSANILSDFTNPQLAIGALVIVIILIVAGAIIWQKPWKPKPDPVLKAWNSLDAKAKELFGEIDKVTTCLETAKSAINSPTSDQEKYESIDKIIKLSPIEINIASPSDALKGEIINNSKYKLNELFNVFNAILKNCAEDICSYYNEIYALHRDLLRAEDSPHFADNKFINADSMRRIDDMKARFARTKENAKLARDEMHQLVKVHFRKQ